MIKQIAFRRGYKYQLAEEYRFYIGKSVLFLSPEKIPRFMSINPILNKIIVHPGYAWDGPSCPAIDTHTAMRASLEHDVLYQLIRLEVLPQCFRKTADERYRKTCRADGMGRFRAWYHFRALRWGARKAAHPESVRKIHYAPRGKA